MNQGEDTASLPREREIGPPGGLKTFRCGDVVPRCGAEFEGTEARIVALASAHAVHGHGVEPDEELLDAVRRAIRGA